MATQQTIRRPSLEKLYRRSGDGDDDSSDSDTDGDLGGGGRYAAATAANTKNNKKRNNNKDVESSLGDSNNAADDDLMSLSDYQYSSYTPPESRITLSWTHVSVFLPLPPTPVGASTAASTASPSSPPPPSSSASSDANCLDKILCWRRKQASASSNTNTKQLLRNVYGIAKPGSVLAVIGSSGAGKSTLMNILMGRIANKLIVNGKVKANGAVVGKDITKLSAYLQQDDLFHPSLTVEEHMWFHSKLRMSGERYSDKDRRSKIKSILHELGLTACEQTMIGGQSGGHVGKKTLSGGERKRLAFATEILTNPALLFCDEPTTGLDSFMAENVVQSMKHLALRGKTIVCTLHQPSSQIISLLDNVLVLSEGRVVFLGAVKDMTEYFATIGYECPLSYNPFDHVIAVLSSPLIAPMRPKRQQRQLQQQQRHVASATADDDNSSNNNKADWLADVFHDSNYYKKVRQDIKSASQHGAAAILLKQKIEAGLEPASTWMQYKMSIWRSSLMLVRNKTTFVSRIFQSLFFAAIYSLVFANQKYDQRGATNLMAVTYQMATIGVWENLEPYAMSIPLETPIYLRDQQAALYTPLAYYSSRVLLEIPQTFGFSFLFVTIIYWSVNLYPSANHYLLAVIIHAAAGWCSSGIGYLIGFSVDNLAISNGLRRAMGPVLSYTAGMYINLDTIPIWISWLRYVSPTYYVNELLQVNQWTDVDHLECPSTASSCFPDGDSILEFYGFDNSHIVRNIVALAALAVGFRTLAFIVLVYRTHRHKNDA